MNEDLGSNRLILYIFTIPLALIIIDKYNLYRKYLIYFLFYVCIGELLI